MLPRSLLARRWVAGCWLLLSLGGCGGNEEPLRDAWALWLEYEPVCDEPRSAGTDPSLTPRWRRALASLNAETGVVMEELLAEARAERSETGRLLIRLTAASRALCELTGADSPQLHRARAEVALARSRLAVAMPLSEDEVWRRAARYSSRLSAAVSTALEGGERDGGPGAERSSVDRIGDAAAEGARLSGEARAGSPPGRGSVAVPAGVAPPRAHGRDRAAEPLESEGHHEAEDETISIRPTSGRSWAEVRRLRGERAARRLAEWRPLYHEQLRPVLEIRRRLARQLEGESLEALGEPCRRLGRAAEEVPASIVASAPAADLGADIAALLAAYADAGRACAAGRPVLAWARLSAGDRHWAAAVATLERLAREPLLPPSLRGRAVDGAGAGGRRVE